MADANGERFEFWLETGESKGLRTNSWTNLIKHLGRIATSIVECQPRNRYCSGPDFCLMEGSCLEIVQLAALLAREELITSWNSDWTLARS